MYFVIAVTGKKKVEGGKYMCLICLSYFDRIVAYKYFCDVKDPLYVIIQSKIWRVWKRFATFKGRTIGSSVIPALVLPQGTRIG